MIEETQSQRIPATIRCESRTRSATAALGIVLATESVFFWAMFNGYLDRYWLIAAVAIGLLGTFSALIVGSISSARFGVELRDGTLHQLGNQSSVAIRDIKKIEYKPLTTELVISDEDVSVVRASLFAKQIGVLLSAVLSAGGISDSCSSVDRRVGHAVLGFALAFFAVVCIAVALKHRQVEGFASLLVVVLAVGVGAFGAYTLSVVRIARSGQDLILSSRVAGTTVSLEQPVHAEIAVRCDGEFWPRIECIVREEGGSERRIPASGLNLLALSCMMQIEKA